MEFVYLDEQYESIDDLPYSASVGFVIRDDEIDRFRELVYGGLSKLLGASDGPLSRIPPLHGSKFLDEYSDPQKIAAYRILLNSVRDCNAIGFRVGYFDESSPQKNVSKAEHASTALAAGVLLTFGPEYPTRFLIISEFDIEALKRGIRPSDDNIATLYQMEKTDISISLENFMGHHYASKGHLGCEIADVLGYLCLKADNPKSPFAIELAQLRVEYSDIFRMDRIIYWNKEEMSFIRS